MHERDVNKCYLGTNVYNENENVESELLHGTCNRHASCGKHGKFSLAHYDCAEHFKPRQEECIHQYAHGTCCSVHTVCGKINFKK